MADESPYGFLFVCRTARGQHKRGGNVAVAWNEPPDEREPVRLCSDCGRFHRASDPCPELTQIER